MATPHGSRSVAKRSSPRASGPGERLKYVSDPNWSAGRLPHTAIGLVIRDVDLSSGFECGGLPPLSNTAASVSDDTPCVLNVQR